MHALSLEGNRAKTPSSMTELIELFNTEVARSINELRNADIDELPDERTVRRKLILTTLTGLYVHAAEHTMLYVGQLLVTVKILRGFKN